MNIFEEIDKLNFPSGSYVVVGSGHLIALGLKEGTDIDIVVTPELFEKCCQDASWEQIPWTYPEKLGQIFLRKGIVELYLDVNAGGFNPATMELIQRAVIINNIPFASLKDILAFKKEYLKTKPKHQKDIELIEKLLG